MTDAKAIAAIQAAAEQARKRGGFADYLEAIALLEKAEAMNELSRLERLKSLEREAVRKGAR